MAKIVLTASSKTTELAELQDNRVRITTPGGRVAEGIPSWIFHRAEGGLWVHWSGAEDWPSVVPYGSHAEIVSGGAR